RERLRIPRSHALGRLRWIPLHADREHVVTAAEQKSVAGIDIGIAVRAAPRAVERRHRGDVSAIDRIDEHTPARHEFDRLQQMELGAVLYESVAVRRREIQIADRFVTRISRVRGEMQHAREVFVGTARAEGTSCGKRSAGLDLYACDRHRLLQWNSAQWPSGSMIGCVRRARIFRTSVFEMATSPPQVCTR